MLKNIDNVVQTLNGSKFFAAFVMLMLNIGSRYIDVKFSKSQEHYLKNTLGKHILVFAVSWMGTRDIYMALTITLFFILLVDFVLNEDSELCVVPNTLTKVEQQYDLNNDGIISEDEIRKAQEILKKSTLQKATIKHKNSFINSNATNIEYFHFI